MLPLPSCNFTLQNQRKEDWVLDITIGNPQAKSALVVVRVKASCDLIHDGGPAIVDQRALAGRVPGMEASSPL